jgi:hypothetical protein
VKKRQPVWRFLRLDNVLDSELDAIAPVAFGLIKRFVCVIEQL